MNRRSFTFGGLCGCATAMLACTPTGYDGPTSSFVAPGYAPGADSDEAGFWHSSERTEEELKQSRFLVRSPELTGYLRDIVCRVAGEHCRDIRLYVVRTPHFNASMMPNGAMQIWTGLLLRCRNEAQIASVIGHELGHYLRRHTLARYNDVRSKADFGAFLGLGLAVAKISYVGTVAQLALLASIYGFTRDQEREADAVGFDLMSRAGYEPIEAARVWDQLIAERKVSTARQSQDIFFATHPAEDERAATLRQLAEARPAAARASTPDLYLARLAPYRAMLLEDELRLQRYARSEIIVRGLIAERPGDGLLWFYEGEIHRLRNAENDAAAAMTAYQTALGLPGAPPEAHRSIGLMQMRAGDRVAANRSFQRYLELKPDATDRAAIRSMLTTGS